MELLHPSSKYVGQYTRYRERAGPFLEISLRAMCTYLLVLARVPASVGKKIVVITELRLM